MGTVLGADTGQRGLRSRGHIRGAGGESTAAPRRTVLTVTRRTGLGDWSVVGEGVSEMTSNSDPSGKGRPREGRGEEHHGRKEQLVTAPKARTRPITAMERLGRLQPRGPRMAGDVGVQRRGSRRHVRGIWRNLDSEVNHHTPDPVLSKWENQGSSLNPKPQFSRCVMPPSNGGGCGPAGRGGL